MNVVMLFKRAVNNTLIGELPLNHRVQIVRTESEHDDVRNTFVITHYVRLQPAVLTGRRLLDLLERLTPEDLDKQVHFCNSEGVVSSARTLSIESSALMLDDVSAT